MPPSCCIPSPNASRAERMFCAYNNSGPVERRGLTYDNKEVPSWAVLLERRRLGDVGSEGVIAKWEAVADAPMEEPPLSLVEHGWTDDFKAGLNHAAHLLMRALDRSEWDMASATPELNLALTGATIRAFGDDKGSELLANLRAERDQLLKRLTPEPAIPLPDGYEDTLIASLAEHGWIAEWESQEPDASPARYVRGCLTWTYGVMALTRQPSLELSIHGLSGVWTAVDLIDTPAAEVREKMEAFAKSCLSKDAPYFAAALAEAEVVTDSVQIAMEIVRERDRQIEKDYTAEHDDNYPDKELPETAALVLMQSNSFSDTSYTSDEKASHILDKHAGNRRHQLIIAAALVVAEIERLDRLPNQDAP